MRARHMRRRQRLSQLAIPSQRRHIRATLGAPVRHWHIPFPSVAYHQLSPVALGECHHQRVSFAARDELAARRIFEDLHDNSETFAVCPMAS